MKVEKEVIEEWKKYWLSLGHSYPSTRTYYSFIKRFVGEGIDINQKNIDNFREKNMSTPARSSLKSFFDYLVKRKDFPEEILRMRFDKSITRKKFPKSLSIYDAKLIINNMTSLKLKVFTLFLYQAGLRISEGLKVSWNDIDFSEWLRNREGYGNLRIVKTKRGSFRVVPINKDLMELLYSDTISPNKSSTGIPLAPIGEKFNLIFNFGIKSFVENKEKEDDENKDDYIIYAETVYRRKLYKVSQEVLGYKVSPHVFRHSRAQNLLDSGVSLDGLKSFLGHAAISTTEIYAQASPEKVKKELREFDVLTQDGMNLIPKKEEVKDEKVDETKTDN